MSPEGEFPQLRQALYDRLLAEKAELLRTDRLPSAAAAWAFALHLELLLRRLEAAQMCGKPARLRKYLVALLLFAPEKAFGPHPPVVKILT
jgi:hypothetical protein